LALFAHLPANVVVTLNSVAVAAWTTNVSGQQQVVWLHTSATPLNVLTHGVSDDEHAEPAETPNRSAVTEVDDALLQPSCVAVPITMHPSQLEAFVGYSQLTRGLLSISA
jgi:hypothetical protein